MKKGIVCLCLVLFAAAGCVTVTTGYVPGGRDISLPSTDSVKFRPEISRFPETGIWEGLSIASGGASAGRTLRSKLVIEKIGPPICGYLRNVRPDDIVRKHDFDNGVFRDGKFFVDWGDGKYLSLEQKNDKLVGVIEWNQGVGIRQQTWDIQLSRVK